MKPLFFLLLFPLCVLADVRIKNLVTGARADQRIAIGTFSVGKGGVALNLDTGEAVLRDCTPEEAANAFWDIVDEKFPASSPLAVTHVQFGKVGVRHVAKGIRVGLFSGTVRWPGIIQLDQASREFWDQVQLVYKDRYPNGRRHEQNN